MVGSVCGSHCWASQQWHPADQNPADEADVAKLFTRAKKDRIAELLATLAAIGKARELEDGRYVAA